MIQELVEIIKQDLTALHEEGKSMFITSSFQTQSLPLLHIVSELPFKVPVAFIDTGYLFPETYIFKDMLQKSLGLDIRTIRSELNIIDQRDFNQRLIFTSNPNKCCDINKVLPMQKFAKEFDVWISGVRRDQSATRKALQKYQVNTNGNLRYHPMLEWTSKLVFEYRKKFDLPEHPLEEKGYLSVGCVPCTSKYLDASSNTRGGRWQGMNKQECGLHTTLAK